MVLYQIVSTYQLLCAIVHKLTINKDKKAVLLYSEWTQKTYPNYKYLERYFEKVVLYDNGLRLEAAEYTQDNDDYIWKILKENEIDLSQFEEIHANAVHHRFGAFLVKNNIPFIFWEDSSGVLSKPEVLINIDSFSNDRVAFCMKYGLYDASAPCIQKRVIDKKSQKPGFVCENAEDFNVVKSFMSLPEELQKEIKLFYMEKEKFDIPKDAVLFLTQHLANLRVMTIEEQALIYQLVIDYFMEGKNVVFKPHPNDILYYSLLFPKAKIIREKFPSEFLPTMFTNKPKCVATISSTAVNTVREYFDEVFELSPEFETEFRNIHKYVVACDLKNKLFSDFKHIFIGVNLPVLNHLTVSGKGKSNFYVIDNLEKQSKYKKEDIIKLLKNLNDNDVVAFLNTKNDYCFYDIFEKDLWQHIIPITIEKTQLRSEEFYADEETETIYIFVKNKKLKQLVETFKFNKNLKNTGLNICAKVLDEEERQICILEALVAATEHLLYLFETNEDFIVTNNVGEIKQIRFSDSKLDIDKLSKNQNRMRILEGILNSAEARLIYYINKQKGEK